MSNKLIKSIVDASGAYRVLFFKTDEGTVVFQEERYWEAAPEDEGVVWGWQPAGAAHSGLYADLKSAMKEAFVTIQWLSDQDQS